MRLITIGITTPIIYGTEHRGWIIGIHESARSIIDRLSTNRHIVGIHYSMYEPYKLPFRN
ncbi:hypothetical protein D3C78_1516040 [compost metagenome]